VATRAFFVGLLPEGDKRRLIAQTLHVSRQNDFALLYGIGGECAGAVSLLEPGQQADLLPPAQAVRWLDESALIALLNELPRRPMLAGEEGLRLSLAGAQDKLPVVFSEGRAGLPLQNTPSSHILKPAGWCLAAAAPGGLLPSSGRMGFKQWLLWPAAGYLSLTSGRLSSWTSGSHG